MEIYSFETQEERCRVQDKLVQNTAMFSVKIQKTAFVDIFFV